jgi:hypothetical protein
VKCDRIECNKRYFSQGGGDSFVCVCNSTFCDTIDSIDRGINQNQYQEFVTCKDGYRADKFINKFEDSPANSMYSSFKHSNQL